MSGYRPGLQEMSFRERQESRYEQLAGLMHQLSNGRFSEASLQRSAAAAHLLTRDGYPQVERIERFMNALRIPIPNWDDPDDAWGNVVDGDSF